MKKTRILNEGAGTRKGNYNYELRIINYECKGLGVGVQGAGKSKYELRKHESWRQVIES
jgi:hypothetical protein